MSRSRGLPLALALLWLVAAACVPHVAAPADPSRTLPASFGGQPSAAPQATSAAQQAWNELFSSPELRALIGEALAKNQELDIRLQEIIIAKAERLARTGEYLPQIHAGANLGVEKVGERTSQGAADEANELPKNLGDFRFGLAATWEVDIWKRMRNAAKAADLRYLASIEARNFLITQLVAEIARSYYELLAIDNQLEVLARNIQIQTDALEVVKLQKQAARVTELAVQRFEAEVLRNKRHRFELELERVVLENRINFLVGRYPQPVPRDPSQLKAPITATVAIRSPAALLDNRPDIRQAELELAAAKLDVKAARAAFYPSLSVEAGLGYRSYSLLHLLATPASFFYGLASGLTQPIWNRRGLTAAYVAANARQAQVVKSYERTVLQAFTDVATQLGVIDNLRQAYDLQTQQVAMLAQAAETSQVLFQSARADYMEVLLTRRDSVEAEMELVETKLHQLQALVSIYQALGGGWRAAEMGTVSR